MARKRGGVAQKKNISGGGRGEEYRA